jgi:hypothetical protein
VAISVTSKADTASKLFERRGRRSAPSDSSPMSQPSSATTTRSSHDALSRVATLADATPKLSTVSQRVRRLGGRPSSSSCR